MPGMAMPAKISKTAHHEILGSLGGKGREKNESSTLDQRPRVAECVSSSSVSSTSRKTPVVFLPKQVGTPRREPKNPDAKLSYFSGEARWSDETPASCDARLGPSFTPPPPPPRELRAGRLPRRPEPNGAAVPDEQPPTSRLQAKKRFE